MSVNDFYIAIQGILDDYHDFGWTQDQLRLHTEYALEEFCDETFGPDVDIDGYGDEDE